MRERKMSWHVKEGGREREEGVDRMGGRRRGRGRNGRDEGGKRRK